MPDNAIEELIIAYLEEKLNVLVVARNVFSPLGVDCHAINFKIASLYQVLVWVRNKEL